MLTMPLCTNELQRTYINNDHETSIYRLKFDQAVELLANRAGEL